MIAMVSFHLSFALNVIINFMTVQYPCIAFHANVKLKTDTRNISSALRDQGILKQSYHKLDTGGDYLIFCNCDQCGLRFRKGHYKHPVCLRCGNPQLWEENIPDGEVSIVERVADEILRKRYQEQRRGK